jgi:hypothetical protein
VNGIYFTFSPVLAVGVVILLTTVLAPQDLAWLVAPPLAPPLLASPVNVAAPFVTVAAPFVIDLDAANLSAMHF